MKKLFFLLLLLVFLTGCGRNSESSHPVYPSWVDPNDPWQRYPDGSPGVIDMRLDEKSISEDVIKNDI